MQIGRQTGGMRWYANLGSRGVSSDITLQEDPYAVIWPEP